MFIASYRNTERGIAARKPKPAPSAVILEFPQAPTLTEFQKIEAKAIKLFRIDRVQLRATRAQRSMTLARQFVMYWACRRTSLSLPQIGRLMGGRDHTTIMAGRRAYVAKRAKMGRALREAR